MRILLITNNNVPGLGSRGGGFQRTDLICRALERVGEVHLLAITEAFPPAPECLKSLEGRCVLAGHFEHPAPTSSSPRGPLGRLAAQLREYTPDPAIARCIREYVAQHAIEAIVVRYLRTLRKAGVHLIHGTPVILDVDDLDADRLESEASFRHGGRLRFASITALRIRHLKRLMSKTLRICRHAWFASDADRIKVNAAHSSVLPNIPYPAALGNTAPPATSDPSSRVILVVANLSGAPNRHGIDCFLDQVWPQVRAAEPGARLQIVGSELQQRKAEQWSACPGVEVRGFVEDLALAYRQAAFSVAPIYWGAGTKIKTLESLWYGRTCVLTPHAHYGLEKTLPHGAAVLRGESSRELAECCIALLKDPRRRDSLAETGQATVLNHYTVACFEQVVAETLGQVGATAAAVLPCAAPG